MTHTFPPLHILIVDDHQETVESLCVVFEAAGFECRNALDGLSALESVRLFTPDVVLMELCIPGLDGFQLAQQLRAMPLEDLVVVALTGMDLDGVKGQCAKAGIDHLLMKPVHPKLLVKLVRNACAIQSRAVLDTHCAIHLGWEELCLTT